MKVEPIFVEFYEITLEIKQSQDIQLP